MAEDAPRARARAADAETLCVRWRRAELSCWRRAELSCRRHVGVCLAALDAARRRPEMGRTAREKDPGGAGAGAAPWLFLIWPGPSTDCQETPAASHAAPRPSTLPVGGFDRCQFPAQLDSDATTAVLPTAKPDLLDCQITRAHLVRVGRRRTLEISIFRGPAPDPVNTAGCRLWPGPRPYGRANHGLSTRHAARYFTPRRSALGQRGASDVTRAWLPR